MGLFVTIEGGDGSGKATQAARLSEYAEHELELDVLSVTFPQYGANIGADIVGRYLANEYGNPIGIAADLASLPYAIDRFTAKDLIVGHLQKRRGIVISDRYVASNLAHQGTKFETDEERHAYYARMRELEYGLFGIPEPDMNIVLLVKTALTQRNIDQKAARTYTDLRRDGHEANTDHLAHARANYEELTRLYPESFTAVDCVADEETMRSIGSIQEEIQSLVLTTYESK